MSRRYRIANIFLFDIGWIVIVLGAGFGHPHLATLAGLALLGVHLACAPHRRREAAYLALAGGGGFAVETFNGLVGVLAFPIGSPAPWLCPLWLVALWMLYATLFRASLAFLCRYRVAGAALAAAMAPLSYYAGMRMGALTFTAPTATALAVVAGEYLVATWLLIQAAQRWGTPCETAGPNPEIARAGP